MNRAECLFEHGLWSTRFIVLLAVIFSIISSVILFYIGSVEVIGVLFAPFEAHDSETLHINILITIIGAIDLYLIGVVLLLFGFGLYELFISEINVARVDDECHSLLEICSLDELKSKIIKVIIMVLIVSFFQHTLSMELQSALDSLFMALSILAIAGAASALHRFGV
ncbi:MAG: YqhA family protein [Methanospirillaceae archaeon]|nr:YqhA family protein [Methanospirillaceae archaeon]